MIDESRRRNAEKMFLDISRQRIQRGRRIAPRTPTFRPCIIWKADTPDIKVEGVILDLNGYGMRIRSDAIFNRDDKLYVQMLKDKEYEVPLGEPILTTVVRFLRTPEGKMEYGVKRELQEIKKPEEIKPVRLNPSRPTTGGKVSRMYIINLGEKDSF